MGVNPTYKKDERCSVGDATTQSEPRRMGKMEQSTATRESCHFRYKAEVEDPETYAGVEVPLPTHLQARFPGVGAMLSSLNNRETHNESRPKVLLIKLTQVPVKTSMFQGTICKRLTA